MKSYALGMLEVLGYSVALTSMNEACKGVNIEILSMDCNNPTNGDNAQIPVVVQVRFRGSINEVNMGLEIAKNEALKYINEEDILCRCITSYSDEMNLILQNGKINPR